MLCGPTDPLPRSTRRILVGGTSGAGKSTLRATISATLAMPTVEIDSLFHGPDWTPRPTFVDDVDSFTSGLSWVVEWQYSQVRPLLLARCDVLIWLDHSRWLVMWRVIRRTVERRFRNAELWNGNREPPLWTILTDRDHIIRWAWRTHGERTAEVLAVAAQQSGPIVVRLAGQAQVDAWIRGPLKALSDG